MRLMTGLGNGAAFVPAMALGSAWFSMERRGFATGIVSGGIGVGTLVSGLVVPPILQAFGPEGWRMSWYILGGAVLVISGVVFFFIRNRPEDKALSPVGAPETDDRATTASQKSKASALDWTQIYRMPSVWYLGLVYFFYGLDSYFFCDIFLFHDIFNPVFHCTDYSDLQNMTDIFQEKLARNAMIHDIITC